MFYAVMSDGGNEAQDIAQDAIGFTAWKSSNSSFRRGLHVNDAVLGDGDGTTTFTRASTSSITVASDITTTHHVGRRVKIVGSNTGTIYGKIATSSYSSPNTTLTFTLDSGSINSGDSTVDVYVGSNYTGYAIPVIDEDAMATEKLAEGIRNFVIDQNKLEDALSQKL